MNVDGWTAGQFAVAYVAALLVLGALDGLWLGWVAKGFYQREMGELMADSPRGLPATAFYLLYPVAVLFFGVLPVQDAVGATFIRCAAFGLVAYGTYNLTNLSIIRGFSVPLGIVDMAWGKRKEIARMQATAASAPSRAAPSANPWTVRTR